MPWLLLIIKHILPISELYSSFQRTDLTTGDILVASVPSEYTAEQGNHGLHTWIYRYVVMGILHSLSGAMMHS